MYLIDVWQKNRLSIAGRWQLAWNKSDVPVQRLCPTSKFDAKSLDISACVHKMDLLWS